MEIPGHYMVLPRTMESMAYARLVLIVRNDLKVQVLEDLMDKEVATIWVKVGTTRRKSVTVGGVYREHSQLGKGETDDSWQERQEKQEWRWKRIIRKWKTAVRDDNCIVIGDLNLDYLCWGQPEQRLEKMVEMVQDTIEIEGFVQLIKGHTRRWRHQADSLLDHCWSNCGQNILRSYNYSRGDSDPQCCGSGSI